MQVQLIEDEGDNMATFQDVTERFLRYVKIDTESDEELGETHSPSTEKQKDLARLLAGELTELGASDVYFDEQYCYVYATIPATAEGHKTIGFISHMDTSPAISGANVNPQIVGDYDGGDIILGEHDGVTYRLSPKEFPTLLDYVGKDLITTDGSTLLGADDKAGVAEIMTMVAYLLSHPQIPHGDIRIGFTPDEEIGAGVDHFDLERFNAEYAYTVDGGALGELEYECFNAAGVQVQVNGRSVHTGDAKGKMKNALTIGMEFQQMLPQAERPELTEGYEGFYHLDRMEGNVEKCTMTYILRDHDREKFEAKKRKVEDVAASLNDKYGEGTVVLKVKDQYYNMAEKIAPVMFLIDEAKAAMTELGITPKVSPIRGGTDGARLSFEGLPCPNLCTGGLNYHGRYEYCCIQSMEKIVELLVNLVQRL